MKNKIKKKEMDWSRLIFRNRHCLAFITIIVFLLTYGFTANATQTQTGTTADMNLLTYYGISQPVFFTRDGINAVVSDSSVLSYSVIPSTGATVDIGYYDGTLLDAFCFISSVNGQDVDWQNGYHIFTIGNTTTTSVVIYDCQGPCYFAVAGTDTSVYSQYPFKYVMRYVNDDGSYVQYEYDDAYNYSSDGLTTYYCGINSGDVFLTDMPLNVASTDSSTGFDRMRNYDVYSVENYTDFNYLLNGGSIVPDAPNNVPQGGGDYQHNMYLNATEKMMQLNSTSYNGKFFPDTDRLFIAFNNFISQNQDKYKIKVTYSSDLKGTAEAPTALQNDYSFDEHFEVVKFIPLTNFVNGTYDVNMGSELSRQPGTIGGVLSGATSNGVYRLMSNENQTSDFSSFMGMLGDRFGLGMPAGNADYWYYNYWTGNKSYIPSEFEWEKHDFKVKINLVYNYNLEEETSVGYYEKTYDVLDWTNYQLNNDDLNTDFNPQYDDDGNPIISPSDNGSSVAGGTTGSSGNQITNSGGSALSLIEKGAFQITVMTGNTGGFQMPTESWNNFGSLLMEMRNDLTTLESDNGILSAMQCIQNVTSFTLPNEADGSPNRLWILMYAGVAGSIAIALWNKAAHNH